MILIQLKMNALLIVILVSQKSNGKSLLHIGIPKRQRREVLHLKLLEPNQPMSIKPDPRALHGCIRKSHDPVTHLLRIQKGQEMTMQLPWVQKGGQMHTGIHLGAPPKTCKKGQTRRL
ncbi:hypothetical protein VPH35_030974 [Triticum aestivum]